MAKCLYAGSIVLEVNPANNYGYYTTFTSFSNNYYGGKYWYTRNGLYESDSVNVSSVIVKAGYNIASSKGGVENIPVAYGDCWTVSVSHGANGTASGGGTVLSGGSVSISATPNAHYTFSSWNDGNTTASRTVTNITADATFTASFAQSEWRLFAATENSAQGTVSLSGWTTGAWFAAGVTKTATATPKPGYRFLGWYRNGQASPDYTTATASLLMYSANTTYTAKFSTTRHTISVSPNYADRGSVKLYVNGVEQASTTGVTVTEGDTIRVVATPQWYCLFYNWTVGAGTGAGADLTFVMPQNDLTVTANINVRVSKILSVAKTNYAKGSITLKRGAVSVTTDTGSSLASVVYAGVEYTLTPTVTDNTLDKFAGWYTSADALIQAAYDYVFTPDGSANIDLVAKFAERSNFTFSKNVSDGSNYVAANPAEAAGNALVQTPSAPDFPSGNYLEGRTITLSAVPAAGWRIASWFVDSEVAEYDQSIPSGTDACPQEIQVSVNANTVVTAHFAVNKYTVTATVDAASVDGGICVVEYEASLGVWAEIPESGVPHGTKVRVISTPNADFLPGGIYEDGALVSDVEYLGGGVYNITAIANSRAFTVKFKAEIGLVLSLSVAGIGTVTALDSDGEAIITEMEVDGSSTAVGVILGETVTLRATELTDGHFKGWFATSDTGFLTPLEGMGPSCDLVVTAKHTYVARFTDTAESIYISLVNEPYGIGSLASSAGTEISESTYMGWLGGSMSTGGDVGINRYYQFTGVTDTIISVVPLTDANFMKWQYRTLDKNGMSVTLGEWTDISLETAFSTVANRHLQFSALYYSELPVPIRVRYREDSNVTNGHVSLSPAGVNVSATSIGVSAEYTQGTPVTVMAVPENGFRFIGWYSAATSGTLLSTTSSYTFDVVAESSVYARFSQDTDAIYKWEGGTANKMVEWRSKRFVATKPFNPSAARVYAGTYPVALNLFMCCSPDAPSLTDPTVSVDARNQDGFRLPIARPEKYLEIEVKTSGELTDAVVSTSMGGLAQ